MPDNPDPWERTHVDLGALSQRVATTERSIEALTQSVSAGFRDLDAKLGVMQTSYSASRSTNWTAILGTGASIAGVVGAFFFSQMSPVYQALDRHEHAITRLGETAVAKEDFSAYASNASSWMTSFRDRLRADEDAAVSQRQIAELAKRVDDHAALDEKSTDARLATLADRMAAIDSALIKRPEIQSLIDAINDRINAINARFGDAGNPSPRKP